MNYSPSKVLKMFSTQETPAYGEKALLQAITNKEIPNFPRVKGRQRKSWTSKEMPLVGEKFGFVKKPSDSQVIYVFVTKGGVLKSSISLNMARLAALHNIKTCVVGLDMQGDVTSALGFNSELEHHQDFKEALKEISQVGGIPEVFFKDASLESIIHQTDLPTLDFIPETPELVAMERALSLKNKREYWLNDHIIEPLKQKYDLIIIDGSPNWNLLTTNALMSTDLLLSPLECKINNFRNYKMFDSFIKEFRQDLGAHFKHVYLPSRLHSQRKLSLEIFDWYKANVENCLHHSIKESTAGEEATAMNLSVCEYSATSELALIYNNVFKEVISALSSQTTASKVHNKSRHTEVTDGPIA